MVGKKTHRVEREKTKRLWERTVEITEEATAKGNNVGGQI